MAASDPTIDVPTSTGTLQGVAAFSWDGSAWQPSGRAGPAVATPTGVLQGVAPFSWDGAAWQPSGRAQPGVATPTGVLDGVAVYTWSGSAWTPTGGTATPSTSTGALRGVAAFSWDGSAWQPAAQARSSVPTPYGVLDGVAFFNWGGSTWQAGAAVPAGATLDLSFLSGTLDPRITFTRASTATYFDATGTMQTAATNAPRFDYDPVTHALRGLLIEEARTNLWLQSADASNAAWGKSGGTVAAPTVTGNQVAAPDGTTTAARVVYPAVSVASTWSQLSQNIVTTANPSQFSMWLRGNAGGERLYLMATADAVTWYRLAATLTTAWQRFTLNMPTVAGGYFIQIGTDLRDASQTSTAAQTVFMWGGQVEAGAFPTSYIPTTAAGVTRAQDQCSISSANIAPWFASPGGSWMAEFINNYHAPTYQRVVSAPPGPGNLGPLLISDAAGFGQYDGALLFTANTVQVNNVTRGATTLTGTAGKCCLNGGAVTSGAMSGGYPGIVTAGISFMQPTASAGQENVTGYIRRVRYWPRVLSNTELQSVTT